MIGIKESKELIEFSGLLPNVIQKVVKDGVGVGLIGDAIGLLTKLSSAFEGIGDIPKEIADLDAAELAELKQLVREKVEVDDNESIELIVENTLITVFSLAKIWKAYLPKG